jgi:ribonuclease E
VRESRSRGGDDVTSLKGSTRLEAKKQRRREGREAGRRRAPILTEAEFLARRESVERVMVVRQHGDRTQIAVLEDDVLVEHYVTRGTSGSMVGNVYLGRVQNVLPSMEAAFVDIGRGRNAVLYAGEVNWDAAGLEGQPKRIEFALKSGDPVLVQVTKDPVGQKGARLTSQISLPGRFLVFVPDGSMTGISRKLPDNERSRLKKVLKRVMPEDAGVIVRTAAEGAPDEALEADVERLKAQWEDISAATKSANPPELLYSEPDLAIKVVRDIFNEDVTSLIVSGDSAWTSLSAYIGSIAPELADRLRHWIEPKDVFAAYRVDEQLMKALDRKVHLPSGGSLVIDRTEAMTVVDVNTGKFTGQGGNLEQTVTRNNLEAAEEIVRQLRLRDIGGIIVVDFIDMVLESNRDLVLRRLVECLGRDRTKHQVAEVTSLGLVQMTRKRIGSGLLESFSETCDHCNGRGIRVSLTADHVHESPKGRKPAGFVDPAEAAARALAAVEQPEGDPAEAAARALAAVEQPEGDAAVEQPEGDAAVEQPEGDAAVEQPEGDAAVEHPEGTSVGAV